VATAPRKPRRERETIREDGPGTTTITTRRRSGEGAAEFRRRAAGKLRRERLRALNAELRKLQAEQRRKVAGGERSPR